MGDSARCRRAAGRRRSPGPCRSGHRKPRWANTSVRAGSSVTVAAGHRGVLIDGAAAQVVLGTAMMLSNAFVPRNARPRLEGLSRPASPARAGRARGHPSRRGPKRRSRSQQVTGTVVDELVDRHNGAPRPQVRPIVCIDALRGKIRTVPAVPEPGRGHPRCPCSAAPRPGGGAPPEPTAAPEPS